MTEKRVQSLKAAGLDGIGEGRWTQLKTWSYELSGGRHALRLIIPQFASPIWYISDEHGFNALDNMADYELLEAAFKAFKQGEGK
jgi:ABC-type uncharacterized transport system ATPase component